VKAPANASRRLLVVANRLPVHRVRRGGASVWATSPGGLVSALTPILRESDGVWIGWPGVAGKRLANFTHDGIDQVPVQISQREIDGFYHGFSNETLWPLYHDAVRTPTFDPDWWGPYVDVNVRFAQATAEAMRDDDVVWVHDYQLQLVPSLLRALRPDARIGFFLHIPFPPVELFAQLPWRRELLRGLLGADLIGFQTRGGAQNFLAVAKRYAGAEIAGDVATLDGHRTRVGAFPISIDYALHDEIARGPAAVAVVERLKRRLGPQRRILLGVDRLDYTKGIDERLRALESLFQSRVLSPSTAVYLQIAVPSREVVRDYVKLRSQVEQRVGRINGMYGEPGRSAVHYLYRSLPTEELVGYYRAADVMLVTPLRDGMNLVAKEYIASRVDNDGVLVLSEFAGAATELRQALLVNPHSVADLADTIRDALAMPKHEATQRMSALRRTVRTHHVHRWSRQFLEALRK
jgi:trehalose 6-phosphate synthase